MRPRWGATVALVVAWSDGQGAPGATLTGFEDIRNLKITGKAAQVSGADAVTEGRSALELQPEASVALAVPAGAVRKVGWLKIDTLEARPVLGCLRLRLGAVTRTAHVRPGKDLLALPLSIAARAQQGPWPAQAVTLTITNAGQVPVVVDNVRLAETDAAPEGTTLLDFGPDNQVLWPGF
ncbi:MAG: hypothetical protein ACYS5V_08100, partial [Planctomycetota bacterium]